MAAPIRPTAEEIDRFTDLGTLLEWAGFNNGDQRVAAAERQDGDVLHPAVTAFSGSLASLLAHYGAAPQTHFRQFASLAPGDFTQFLAEWNPDGAPPSWSLKAAAKLAHATARAICRMDPWADEAPPPPAPQPQQPQQQFPFPQQQPPQAHS